MADQGRVRKTNKFTGQTGTLIPGVKGSFIPDSEPSQPEPQPESMSQNLMKDIGQVTRIGLGQEPMPEKSPFMRGFMRGQTAGILGGPRQGQGSELAGEITGTALPTGLAFKVGKGAMNVATKLGAPKLLAGATGAATEGALFPGSTEERVAGAAMGPAFYGAGQSIGPLFRGMKKGSKYVKDALFPGFKPKQVLAQAEKTQNLGLAESEARKLSSISKLEEKAARGKVAYQQAKQQGKLAQQRTARDVIAGSKDDFKALMKEEHDAYQETIRTSLD